MSNIQFGWGMPSGATDAERHDTFTGDVRRIMALVEGHFDAAWMTDHFQWGERDTLECWTTISYFASLSELKFGTSMLGQGYRNPALVAKMAATLHYLSGGRLILGIGAGWKEDEYGAYGYPFPSPGVRVRQLSEAVQIIRAIWAKSPASFTGQYYCVENAVCAPCPNPAPPIVIGGEGDRLLRVVARYADWWNVSWCGLDRFRNRLEELRRACEEVERDFATVRKTWFGPAAIARTEDEAKALAGGSFSDENGFVGTPDYFLRKIERFAEMGVDYFIMGLRGFPDQAPFELFMREVMDKL